MVFARSSLLVAIAALSAALLGVPSASARTFCRPDGCCFNTSGEPIPDQPRFCYHHHHHHDEGGPQYDWRPYHHHDDENYYQGEPN